MPAYEFNFGEKDVRSIDEQAKAFQRQYQDSGSTKRTTEPRPMVAFLRSGTHTFRVYPDRDRRGFARISRRVWSHEALPVGFYDNGDIKKVWRVWADERVDKIVQELLDQKMSRLADRDVWQYRSRSTHLMCVHMFETSEKDSKYHPAGSSLFLRLSDRQAFAMLDWISEMHPEDKRKLLDPNNDAPGIRLSSAGQGAKANVSVGLAGMRPLHLPMPPQIMDTSDPEIFHEFVTLDDVFVSESNKISEEDFQAFRSFAYAELEKFKALGSSARDTTQEAYRFDPSTHPEIGTGIRTTPRSADDETGDKACLILKMGRAQGDLADARFGNHPKKVNAFCSACEVGLECSSATLDDEIPF